MKDKGKQSGALLRRSAGDSTMTPRQRSIALRYRVRLTVDELFFAFRLPPLPHRSPHAR